MMQRRRRQRGFILLVVLLVLLILSLMGVATMYLAGTGNTLAVATRMDDQAFRAAEAGAMYTMQWAQGQGPASVQCLALANFSTVGFGGSPAVCGQPANSPDVNILDNGTAVQIPGATGSAINMHAAVQIYPSNLPGQSPVKCGLPGFSDKFGEYRFAVRSRGYGPGNTTRTVEAHVYLPPMEGLCPPNAQHVASYPGT